MVAFALSMTATIVVAGCRGEAASPVSPEDAEALLALAPELTMDRLTAELGLDASQSEEFGKKLERFRSMLSLDDDQVAAIDSVFRRLQVEVEGRGECSIGTCTPP